MEEQIRAAIGAGLDGLCFTDHNRLLPPDIQEELNARWAPFRIFSGIEVNTDAEDSLVYGIRDSSLEKPGWTWERLHAFVRESGAFLAIAHPLRWAPSILADCIAFPPDGIEIASNNIDPANRNRIREAADACGACLLANSDSHSISMMGSYCNIFPGAPSTDSELLELLRARSFRPSFPD